MVEIKDKNYSELDEEKSFTEFCELVVKTTDENGNTAEEEKEGIQIKGKDMLYLNSPEIYFSENAPLDTDKRELYAILNELFQGGGEGGDEWQLPESFPNIPRPAGKQIIILLEVKSVGRPMLEICPMPYVFNGSEYIDWGDGSVTVIKPGDTDLARNYSHAYAAEGLYVITINCSELTEYIYLDNAINGTFITGGSFPPAGVEADFKGMDASNDCIRVIEFGEDIYSRTIISGSNKFTGLIYAKYCGNSCNKAASEIGVNYISLTGCSALCRVDYDVFPEAIGGNAYADCVALRNAPFASKLAEIPTSAFQNCTALASADISSAKKVGAAGFQNCTSLCNLKYPEDCVFADGAADNCYSLYPRPDGSKN